MVGEISTTSKSTLVLKIWWYITHQENETAWTSSTDIEIIEAGNGSDGPQVLRMDGGRLIDPFEDEFYLDLPIRMNWDIIGIGGGTMIPQLRIKDMDRDPSIMSESGGRHKQRWVYSDGIQLDFEKRNYSCIHRLVLPILTGCSSCIRIPW